MAERKRITLFQICDPGTPTIALEGSGIDVDSISVVSSVAPSHMYQCKLRPCLSICVSLAVCYSVLSLPLAPMRTFRVGLIERVTNRIVPVCERSRVRRSTRIRIRPECIGFDSYNVVRGESMNTANCVNSLRCQCAFMGTFK